MLFLLLFESRISVPAWLQVFGRMHPLFLHFPIVLLLFALFMEFIRMKDSTVQQTYLQLQAGILLAGGLSAAVTAIMGLLLSHEEGYAGNTLDRHKWAGIGIVLLAVVWYWCKFVRRVPSWLTKGGAALTSIALLMAGHWGADLTHGSDFLLGPVTPSRQSVKVPLEQAQVYEHLVKPVLEEKCMSCHNTSKAKGELVMSSPESLRKGGKSGVAWVINQPDLSLMLQRIHLPLAEKKHMPPSGKPQLTPQEIQVLYYWIKGGASFDQKVAALPATDSLRMLAQQLLEAPPEQKKAAEVYDFAAADEKTLQKLNNNYRVVYPIALHSPALVANFYNRDQYNSNALSELLPLKEQLIELHLQKMPVQDNDLKTISQFKRLQTLNLGFTSIKGKTLEQLASLPRLRTLTLSGTDVTFSQLQPLLASKALKEVYVWNTAVTPAEMTKLTASNPKIAFIKGFKDDGLNPLKLTPPMLENTGLVFVGSTQLKLKHPIRGTEIRFTTDGTEPDSLHGEVFRPGIALNASTVIKARAYKAGWIGSDGVQFGFYRTSHKPDSIVLITPPEGKLSGESAQTLSDLEAGDIDLGSGKWLAYKDVALQAMLFFHEPVQARSVTLCMFRNTDRNVFPPVSVEIWGGNSQEDMKLLQKATPSMPEKGNTPGSLDIECTFKPASLSFIKVIARPLSRLPAWHNNKGQKGWVFADEILVN